MEAAAGDAEDADLEDRLSDELDRDLSLPRRERDLQLSVAIGSGRDEELVHCARVYVVGVLRIHRDAVEVDALLGPHGSATRARGSAPSVAVGEAEKDPIGDPAIRAQHELDLDTPITNTPPIGCVDVVD